MAFHLKKILKAMLASTSDPLSVKDIQAVVTRWHEQREKDADAETDAPLLGGNGAEERAPAQALIRDIISQVPTLLTATQIREAISDLNREMEETGDVTRILQGPEGFRMTIAPEFAEWIRLLRNDPRPQKLSQAALETLAIVAYRQPVTRGEIEAVPFAVFHDAEIPRLRRAAHPFRTAGVRRALARANRRLDRTREKPVESDGCGRRASLRRSRGAGGNPAPAGNAPGGKRARERCRGSGRGARRSRRLIFFRSRFPFFVPKNFP